MGQIFLSHYRIEEHIQRFRGPEFLSISPARSATTWLFQQLRGNPSVYLPEVKETNYLVNGWLDGPYDRFFEGWQPDQLIGDISPNYAPASAARGKRNSPSIPKDASGLYPPTSDRARLVPNGFSN